MGVSSARSPPVFGNTVVVPSGMMTVTGSPVVFKFTSVPSRALLSFKPGDSAARHCNRFQNKIGQSGVFCRVERPGLKFKVRWRRPNASSRAESNGVLPASRMGTSPGALVSAAAAQTTPSSVMPSASGCERSRMNGPT